MPFYPQLPFDSSDLFPDLSSEDLAWAAGLLEGDGSFTSNSSLFPRVCLQIQDRDVCLRIQALFGGSVREAGKREAHHKPIFMWYTPSSREAVEVMTKVYPLMLSRRRRQIENLLTKYGEHVADQEAASPYRDEIFNRVTELTLAGETSFDIAEKVGLSPDMVRRVRHRDTRRSAPRYVHPPAHLPQPRDLGTGERLPWAAGLLEAEGHFGSRRKVRIEATSSDRDVLERLQSILGGKVSQHAPPPHAHWKQAYSWVFRGTAYDREKLLDVLFPMMSSRRQQAIRDCRKLLSLHFSSVQERRARDLKIRELMEEGLSERAISRRLGISRETVAKQRR